MESGKKVAAIIPARGGSKGLPGKNIKILAGKPLIAYTIEAAKQCPLVNRVMVSTDDEDIAEISKKYGAEVPCLRPKDLATDLSPPEEAIVYIINWLEENEGYRFDILLYLQPTDIFRRKYMVEAVIKALIDDDSIDTAFVGYRDHKNYWKESGDKFVPLDERGGHIARQIKERIYREDTGIACATRVELARRKIRIGEKVKIVFNDDIASFIDIHDEFDFWLAEKVVSEWKYPINQ